MPDSCINGLIWKTIERQCPSSQGICLLKRTFNKRIKRPPPNLLVALADAKQVLENAASMEILQPVNEACGII